MLFRGKLLPHRPLYNSVHAQYRPTRQPRRDTLDPMHLMRIGRNDLAYTI